MEMSASDHDHTGHLAREPWTGEPWSLPGLHPTVLLMAREENTREWTLCGGLDYSIWEAVPIRDRVKLMMRWGRDAGLNKSAAKRMTFILVVPPSAWVEVDPFGVKG